MQVRGLPRRIIRNGRTASRWRQAMTDGLAAEQVAQAVGVPRSSL